MGRAGLADIFPHWADPITVFLEMSRSMAVGLFDVDGRAIYANAAMTDLLGSDDPASRAADAFITPPFNRLVDPELGEGPVFDGLVTLGPGRDTDRTIQARAFRRGDHLLLIGECDVAELETLNRQMREYNREINNLQRKLIKEKATLERTLAELQETQAMLIHSEKMNAMGQLVAGVAHEINNPIAYVSSNVHSLGDAFAELMDAYTGAEDLIRDGGPPEMTAAVEKLRADHDIDFLAEDFDDLREATAGGLDRVNRIVADLRAFSRLDEAEENSVDLAENIESSLAVAGPELKKQGVTVELDLHRPLTAECYPAQLNQVFLNLAINAAQAMDGGGTLRVTGRRTADEVVLTFEDTGRGIPEEIRDQIFNPFFTTKPVGQGTGLGLSLAYRIITGRHGGTLQVESTPGEGTVFTLTIPTEIDHDRHPRADEGQDSRH